MAEAVKRFHYLGKRGGNTYHIADFGGGSNPVVVEDGGLETMRAGFLWDLFSIIKLRKMSLGIFLCQSDFNWVGENHLEIIPFDGNAWDILRKPENAEILSADIESLSKDCGLFPLDWSVGEPNG